MRTHISRRGVLALAGLIGLGGSLRLAHAMARRPEFPGVQRLSGDVRVNGLTARVGTLVQPGDTLTTGPDSHVIFVVGEDVFLLRDNGRITVGGQGGILERIRIHTGRILSVFAPRKTRRHFDTSTAVIGVRGTGLYIESEPDRTYVCTCYGTTELAASGDPNARETVTSTYHEAPRYIHRKGARSGLIEPAKVINHTDDELYLLEWFVGRLPPFHLTQSYYY